MPLNAEEKYEQEKFKLKQYSRPTLERLTYSESDIDKLFEQRGQIIEACRQVSTDTQFSDGLFKDRIMAIVGWKR